MASHFDTIETAPHLITPIVEMANNLMNEFEEHQPLLDHKVKIDFILAYAEKDDNGCPKAPAIMHQGHPANGLCRILNLKDRAKGNGDAEILIDGDWWQDAATEEQRALLDHELHHLSVVVRKGAAVTDDLNRPKLEMRHHDLDFGWFDIIAARHRHHSQECQQAKMIREAFGDLYWPTGEPTPIIRKERKAVELEQIEGV